MIIVLTTGGKRDEVYSAKVNLFQTREEALEYCYKTTNNGSDVKYWTCAEIIEQDKEYEMSRDGNHS